MSEVNKEDGVEPRVVIGPHPLGGIQVAVKAVDGESLATRIDLPEATILVAHLNALISMMFQSMYAQAMSEPKLKVR